MKSLASLLASTLLATLLPSAAHAEARPNIVFILADDLGYADVGFNGSDDITTPRLDALAANGVVFSSAYAIHPFCGPSRLGLMTGRYPHEIGGSFNLPPNRFGHYVEGVPVSETLFSTVLQNAGYTTGLVGKWHLGIEPEFHPNVRGFDDFYGFLGGGHDYFPEKYQPQYAAQVKAGNDNPRDYITPLEHNGQDVRETEYLTDGLSREACRFVREAAGEDHPFFLYVSYNAPHTPLQAKEEDMARFPEIADLKRKTYAGMVYAMDRGIGAIVDTLKETGTLDNTLVIFMSDNGGRPDQGASNRPLQEGKGSAYEGGHRSPMLMHWPAALDAGSRYDHPVTAMDLYPTFAQLAGATIPEGKDLDGHPLTDAIRENRSARPGETFYVVRHQAHYSDVCARRDNLKAVRVNMKPWQLFDVDADPGETKDLRPQHPDALAEIVGDFREMVKSHTQPEWFHAPETGEKWRAAGMPNFEKTLSLD